MTIRAKLLLSFTIMLVTVLVVAAISLWSIMRWRAAATEVTIAREQNFLAERLRAAMTRKVNLGLDFLDGAENLESDFARAEIQIHDFITALKTEIATTAESDHIVGLEQTHEELSWVINSFRNAPRDDISNSDLVHERRRLREIADEVSDDVAALNQYYRGTVDRSVRAASEAGRSATWAIACAVLVAFVQLIAMAAQMQRWMVRPFAEVKKATTAISKGRLETRIETTTGNDEWGEMAQSINDMARSLKLLQHQLATRERFAALGELGAYTAHNIRNPLAGVRAAIQVLIPEIPDTHLEIRETMAEIIATIDRLDAWVKGFLEFARPLQLTLAEVDINETVNNVFEIIRGKYSQNGIRLNAALDRKLPRAVVDSILIEQAIAALVTNACESGGDTVSVETAHVTAESGMGLYSIRVKDNGMGISEAMQNKLFRVFSTDKKGGTGLGLAQAKKIIELHSGTLTLEESTAKGTIFTIRLPFVNETHTSDENASN